jgi:hypothetical protein
VRNLATGAIARASAKADGSQLDGASYAPALSGDGRYVAFASRAGAVTPEAGGAVTRARVYRKDLLTGAVELVSVGIDLAPRTLIDAPLGKLPRRQARDVIGTSEDDGVVARVDVSLSRPIGHGRCLALAGGSRVVRAACAKPVWLRAHLVGGLRFTLAIRHILPRGSWRLRTRATDQTGKVEPVRSGTNSVVVRLV